MPANPDDARARAVEMLCRVLAGPTEDDQERIVYWYPNGGGEPGEPYGPRWETYRSQVEDILTAYPQIARLIAEPGMVVVPEVATEEQITAALDAHISDDKRRAETDRAYLRRCLAREYAAAVAAAKEPQS